MDHGIPALGLVLDDIPPVLGFAMKILVVQFSAKGFYHDATFSLVYLGHIIIIAH